jgi:hypothetical protein
MHKLLYEAALKGAGYFHRDELTGEPSWILNNNEEGIPGSNGQQQRLTQGTINPVQILKGTKRQNAINQVVGYIVRDMRPISTVSEMSKGGGLILLSPHDAQVYIYVVYIYTDEGIYFIVLLFCRSSPKAFRVCVCHLILALLPYPPVKLY